MMMMIPFKAHRVTGTILKAFCVLLNSLKIHPLSKVGVVLVSVLHINEQTQKSSIAAQGYEQVSCRAASLHAHAHHLQATVSYGVIAENPGIRCSERRWPGKHDLNSGSKRSSYLLSAEPKSKSECSTGENKERLGPE